MKPWSKPTIVCLLGVSVFALAGCEGDGRPGRVPVSGRVLIDGMPLEQGNIRIHPQNHRAASAKLGPDGKFTLSTYELGDGSVVGKHPVSVIAAKEINRRTRRWYAPKKYASAATSELTLEVTEPTESAEVHLTWDGGKPFDERIEGGD